jgi:microcystin-dependent protein
MVPMVGQISLFSFNYPPSKWMNCDCYMAINEPTAVSMF